jgi:hypothetical protein
MRSGKGVRNRMSWGRPRVALVASGSVIAVCLVGSLPGPALANDQPAAPRILRVVFPAPVGHRQPTARDLPPDVLRDENMKPPAGEAQSQSQAQPQSKGRDAPAGNDNALWPRGEDLQICRGC